jgi:hypothetical protein
MTSMLLLLVGQTLAAPALAPDAPDVPPKTPPSIYALVFAAKRPAKEQSGRGQQMPYEAAHCRSVLDTVLRADTVSRLTVVRKQKNARTWLEKNLRVDSLDDTGVLRISLAEGSPAEQVAIVNAVAKAYHQEATDRIRRSHEDVIAHDAKTCAIIREKVRVTELQLMKLNGVKVKDDDEGERIIERRNGLARSVGRWKEIIEDLEAKIREDREYLRKPPVIILESAELPPEAK